LTLTIAGELLAIGKEEKYHMWTGILVCITRKKKIWRLYLVYA
jgi:hypothetical protein